MPRPANPPDDSNPGRVQPTIQLVAKQLSGGRIVIYDPEVNQADAERCIVSDTHRTLSNQQ